MDPVPELVQRLERVERTVRRQRVAISLVLCVLALAGLSAALAPQFGERLVQARQFLLIDGKGAVRARLALSSAAAPNPFLELLDGEGKPFARLGAHPQQSSEPSLVLSHPGGAPAVELLGGGAGPDLALRGLEGQSSVWLSASNPSDPRISLHEEAGEGRVVLGLTEGSGFLSIFREVEDEGGEFVGLESSLHVSPKGQPAARPPLGPR